MILKKNDAIFTSSVSKIFVLATILVILINPMNSCSVSIQSVPKVTHYSYLSIHEEGVHRLWNKKLI